MGDTHSNLRWCQWWSRRGRKRRGDLSSCRRAGAIRVQVVHLAHAVVALIHFDDVPTGSLFLHSSPSVSIQVVRSCLREGCVLRGYGCRRGHIDRVLHAGSLKVSVVNFRGRPADRQAMVFLEGSTPQGEARVCSFHDPGRNLCARGHAFFIPFPCLPPFLQQTELIHSVSCTDIGTHHRRKTRPERGTRANNMGSQ